jgi:hypothetical protein
MVQNLDNAHEKNTLELLSMISGFRRDVEEIYAVLGDYEASCGNCLPTVRDNVSVPSSSVSTLDP